MPACHAGDRGFESRRLRHLFQMNVSTKKWESYQDLPIYFFDQITYGSVAQSVEQRTENPRVGGSIPSRATII